METTHANETLLKFLHRIAAHFKLENAETFTFRKRKGLLDKLKEADEAAWLAINTLIESQLRVDRILADKEKEQKNFSVWSAELEKAKTHRAEAGSHLAGFFKDHKVSMEGLTLEGFI